MIYIHPKTNAIEADRLARRLNMRLGLHQGRVIMYRPSRPQAAQQRQVVLQMPARPANSDQPA